MVLRGAGKEIYSGVPGSDLNIPPPRLNDCVTSSVIIPTFLLNCTVRYEAGLQQKPQLAQTRLLPVFK